MQLENLILKGLVEQQDFYSRVIPHLKTEYFHDASMEKIVELFQKYVEKYNRAPNYSVLKVLCEKSGESGNIPEEVYNGCEDLLKQAKSNTEEIDYEWLLSETESHFRNQAVLNALAESIDIHEKITKGKKDKMITDIGAIPDILTSALQVSFDTSTGHDWLGDADERFMSYLEKVDKIPFDIEILNKATGGGAERGTINVILAGCVHPDTEVDVRIKYRTKTEWPVYRMKISVIKSLLDTKKLISYDDHAFDVEVKSPDGWVSVTEYVEKGEYIEYVATTDETVIRCNEDHLFETDDGWKRAADMTHVTHKVLHESGEWVDISVVRTGNTIEIVDIQVDHPNHRYYTQGISSHNTNSGKSLGLVHLGRHYAMNLGMNVVYCSFEMGENIVGKRVDAGAMKMSMDDFGLMTPKVYSKKIDAIKKKTKGSYHFKQFPTAGANVTHIRNWLRELELKKGIRPDVIIIDYLGIMLSSRLKSSDHSYSWVKSIAEECRGLMIEYNAVGWSAAQTNREGNNTLELDLNHVGESAGLSHTVDFMMAAAESEELAQQGKQVIRQLKSRYGDKNKYKTFLIGVDKNQQRWYDVNDKITEQVSSSAVQETYGTDDVLTSYEADDIESVNW